MRQQKQDSTIKYITSKSWVSLILLLSGLVFTYSCRNSIDEIQALSNQLDLPAQSGKEIEVWYSDSGKLQLKFIAPLMREYTKKENGPYYEFPAGVRVLFYDNLGNPESQVIADYAIYYEEKKLWEARDSVVARNLKTNEQLETEQLYWDLDKKLVYSIVFTKITNKDGVYYGENGFEATQDMKKYKLKGSSGTVNVQNEEIQ